MSNRVILADFFQYTAFGEFPLHVAIRECTECEERKAERHPEEVALWAMLLPAMFHLLFARDASIESDALSISWHRYRFCYVPKRDVACILLGVRKLSNIESVEANLL